jgi:hypothetical protein
VRHTTQRKALAAVLGLGAVALLVDKLVLGPSGAAAAPEATVAATTATPTTSPTPTVQPAAPSRVGGTLLAALRVRPDQWTDDAISASLRPTPAWALDADPEPARPAPAKSLEGRFCEKYRLKAVIGSDASVAALVEAAGQPAKVLQLGSDIDGFKLVRVENNIAYFEAGSQHAELTVAGVQDKR